MYIKITRGKRRGTDDAAAWFGGKPSLIDRLVLWWMSPADNFAHMKQNSQFSTLSMVLVLSSFSFELLTHNSLFTILELLFLAFQLNVSFVRDMDTRRSLPTILADRWLNRRRVVSISKSRALLALGDDGGRHSGEVSAAVSVLEGHPELHSQINTYLTDPQTHEWETVLSTMPATASLEDTQLAKELSDKLTARARAVLSHEWPAPELPELPLVSQGELENWRSRAAEAAGDTNWHPLRPAGE